MRVRRFIGLVFVGLFSMVGATGAQTESAEPPVGTYNCAEDLSGETFTFYHFGDLSNIYSFVTSSSRQGFEDGIAYFNQQGGICGASIREEVRDTRASQEAAQNAWDEFGARDDAHVVVLYLTEDAELVRNQAAEEERPIVVATGSVSSLYGDSGDEAGWVFSATPLYEDQFGAFCDFIAERWDSFGIPGEPVIGHVSWGIAFGPYSDTDATRAYCASKGVGYAGAKYYLPGTPDLSNFVQQVLDEGANILYTTSVSDGPARLASTARALDLKIGEEVLIAGPNWALDASVIQLAGEAGEGLLGQLPYVWWDELDDPGIQAMTTFWAQTRLNGAEDPVAALGSRGVGYLVAFSAVDVYRQLMIDTVNRVGFENLSGKEVYNSLTSGQAYSGLGGVLTLQYDAQRRSPNRASARFNCYNRTTASLRLSSP